MMIKRIKRILRRRSNKLNQSNPLVKGNVNRQTKPTQLMERQILRKKMDKISDQSPNYLIDQVKQNKGDILILFSKRNKYYSLVVSIVNIYIP